MTKAEAAVANLTTSPEASYFNSIIDKYSMSGSPTSFLRNHLACEWYKNFLYYHGCQWMYLNPKTMEFRKLDIPNWVPRSVTNRFREYADSLIALLARVEPNVIVFPAEEKDEDIAAADVANKAIKSLEVENNVSELRRKVARLLTLTGNAFAIVGVEDVQTAEKNKANATLQDMMVSLRQMPDGDEKAAMIAHAEQLNTFLLSGSEGKRNYTDILSPFEVFSNLSVEDIDQQPGIVTIQLKPLDWINETFGTDFKTGEVTAAIPSLLLCNSIPYITDDPYVAGFFGYNENTQTNAYVKRLWLRPNKKYPGGASVTMVRGQIVDEPKPLPVDSLGQSVIPILHFKFGAISNAFFARTPMTQLIKKQQSRNRWESMDEIIHMRHGQPVWVKTTGTKMPPISPEPGSVLDFDLVGDKALPPTRLEGVPVDRGSILYQESSDRQMGEIIHVPEVMKGVTQPSGTPHALAESLISQAMSRFGPDFSHIGETWVKWANFQLMFFKMYGTQMRTFRAINDEGEIALQSFSNADMNGGVNLMLENNSTRPRSDIIDQISLTFGIQNGLVDVVDPKVRFKAQKRLNLSDMASESDVQYKAAARENRLILEGRIGDVVASALLDDADIHMSSHRRAANAPDVTPQQRAYYELHIKDHLMKTMAMQAAQQPAQVPQEQQGKERENARPN